MAMLSVGPDAGHLVEIHPDPADLTWGLQDISSSDSGRVHDAGNTMHKMRTSQKRKLSIKWVLTDASQASAILKAFNPEYFWVRYWDAMEGAFQVRQFYAGDRSAPFQWFQLHDKGTRFASVSFDIIER